MNWYKKTQDDLSKVKDHWEEILGLGKYKPAPSEFKKTKKPRDLQHSMDINENEDDDGW